LGLKEEKKKKKGEGLLIEEKHRTTSANRRKRRKCSSKGNRSPNGGRKMNQRADRQRDLRGCRSRGGRKREFALEREQTHSWGVLRREPEIMRGESPPF